MFKGIKSIASEIRSEVTGHESLSTNGHSHSQSQSSTASSNSTSKTRRFLSNNRNSNGSSGFKKKSKEYIEVDGKTEDETIVHLALLKYFKENSTGIPDYLRSSNGSYATTGSAFDTRRTNESSKSPKTHTYSSSSMAKSMSTPNQQQQQQQPHDRSEFVIPNSTQFRSRQSPNTQLAHSSIPGRPELKKASTESDTYKHHHHHHHHDQFQSQSESPPPVQRHVAPSSLPAQPQQRFAPQRTQSTAGRFQSRFSNNATSNTSGAVSGSSSRFGRRVQ